MLKKFLHVELSGQLPMNLEGASEVQPQGNIEDEEPLEEEDRLAETSLELEIEELAAVDPDVKALEEGEVLLLQNVYSKCISASLM